VSVPSEFDEIVDAAIDAWREGRPWPDGDATDALLVRMTHVFLDREFASIRATMAGRLRGWLDQEPDRMTDDELRIAYEVHARRGYFAKLDERNAKRGPTRIEKEMHKRGLRMWTGHAQPTPTAIESLRTPTPTRAEADAHPAPSD